MNRIALAVVVLWALAAPARAGYQAGLEAYEAGRHDLALEEFRSLAERGDAQAEFMLGVMYHYGKGVPRDDVLAAIWFFKAARKGNANGQLAIGSLHVRGEGVRRDLVKAHMWLTLAAESEIPGLQQQAVLLRDDAARSMPPRDVERARRLAADFTPSSAGVVSTE